MPAPVYADFDGLVLRANMTSNEFKIMLPKKPRRILVNGHHDILAAENTASGN